MMSSFQRFSIIASLASKVIFMCTVVGASHCGGVADLDLKDIADGSFLDADTSSFQDSTKESADSSFSDTSLDTTDSPTDSTFDAVVDIQETASDAEKLDGKPDQGSDAVAQTACQQDLINLGIAFATTQARGVVDAVKLKGPINGVTFSSGTSTSTMGDPVACAFVKTLHAFAVLLKERGFVRVGTLGSYCYRCCCGWTTTNYCRGVNDPEPDCGSNGYSNHSWGRAVDVRYLYKSSTVVYDINSNADFVKFSSTDTCGTGLNAQTGVSKELYDLACEAGKRKIFATILTPNYNDLHRNHYHMDTGQSGIPSTSIVKGLGASETPVDGIGRVDSHQAMCDE